MFVKASIDMYLIKLFVSLSPSGVSYCQKDLPFVSNNDIVLLLFDNENA